MEAEKKDCSVCDGKGYLIRPTWGALLTLQPCVACFGTGKVKK